MNVPQGVLLRGLGRGPHKPIPVPEALSSDSVAIMHLNAAARLLAIKAAPIADYEATADTFREQLYAAAEGLTLRAAA